MSFGAGLLTSPKRPTAGLQFWQDCARHNLAILSRLFVGLFGPSLPSSFGVVERKGVMSSHFIFGPAICPGPFIAGHSHNRHWTSIARPKMKCEDMTPDLLTPG